MALEAPWPWRGPLPGGKRFCAHHRHAFYLRPYYIEFMPTLIAGIVAVILLYSLLQMFRAANPVVLARAIKIGGGVVRQYRPDVRGLRHTTLAGTDVTGSLAVSRHDARSRQRRALRPDRGRAIRR